MKKPIALSISPNTKKEDVFLALRLFFSPLHYFGNSWVRQLEQWFRQYFRVSYAVSFNSGRASLFAILSCLGIEKGDEVILQAFTCIVVPNAIVALKAKPVYADITEALTLDSKDIEKKITKKTKAIIAQHTFGIPSNMTAIVKIAKKHNIALIEDCAHTVGGEYKAKKLGVYGMASFFSFGREKAFSSVFGGMAITNNQEFGKKLRLFQKNQETPSFFWTMQQIFHPIAFSIILPFYNIGIIGKALLVVLQKMQLLSLPVSQGEKQGIFIRKNIKKMPNALACIALFQLRRIKEYNTMREKIGKLYISNLGQLPVVMPYKEVIPYLRFPILVAKPNDVLQFFRQKGIYLGRWYSEIVDPKGTNYEKINYQMGSCPNAELFAKKIINLPAYPTMKVTDAEKVIVALRAYAKD